MINKFKKGLDVLSDWLNDQTWFQNLRTKWEEIDPKNRFYIKLGGVGLAVFLIFSSVLAWIFEVKSLKSELAQKTELQLLIKTALDEMQRLKTTQRSATSIQLQNANWNEYLQATATEVEIDPTSVTINSEKPGNSENQSKESLLDITVKKINIKQLIRYTLKLENGDFPTKIRQLTIEAEDPQGYINANLSISLFELKKQE